MILSVKRPYFVSWPWMTLKAHQNHKDFTQISI